MMFGTELRLYAFSPIKKGITKIFQNIVNIGIYEEAGFVKIYQGMQSGEPVGLIVTDMHYPLAYGADADYDAGFKLIERLKEEKMDIPVIICSSHNYTETAILGTVWYSELRDLRRDFSEVLQSYKNER